MEQYYDTKANALGHPFTIAYNKFEQDKKETLQQMQTHKWAHEQYVMQEQRLFRLDAEQKELLQIMKQDLTSDLLIDILKGK